MVSQLHETSSFTQGINREEACKSLAHGRFHLIQLAKASPKAGQVPRGERGVAKAHCRVVGAKMNGEQGLDHRFHAARSKKCSSSP